MGPRETRECQPHTLSLDENMRAGSSHQKPSTGQVRGLGFENESSQHFLSKHLQVVSLIYFELKNLFELDDSVF